MVRWVVLGLGAWLGLSVLAAAVWAVGARRVGRRELIDRLDRDAAARPAKPRRETHDEVRRD